MGKGDKRRPSDLTDEEIELRFQLAFSNTDEKKEKARLRLEEIDNEKKARKKE